MQTWSKCECVSGNGCWPEAFWSVVCQSGIWGPGMLDFSPGKHLDSNEPMQSVAEVDRLGAIISWSLIRWDNRISTQRSDAQMPIGEHSRLLFFTYCLCIIQCQLCLKIVLNVKQTACMQSIHSTHFSYDLAMLGLYDFRNVDNADGIMESSHKNWIYCITSWNLSNFKWIDQK